MFTLFVEGRTLGQSAAFHMIAPTLDSERKGRFVGTEKNNQSGTLSIYWLEFDKVYLQLSTCPIFSGLSASAEPTKWSKAPSFPSMNPWLSPMNLHHTHCKKEGEEKISNTEKKEEVDRSRENYQYNERREDRSGPRDGVWGFNPRADGGGGSRREVVNSGGGDDDPIPRNMVEYKDQDPKGKEVVVVVTPFLEMIQQQQWFGALLAQIAQQGVGGRLGEAVLLPMEVEKKVRLIGERAVHWKKEMLTGGKRLTQD